MIITIGRQLGSGGGEIGHKLASELGFDCYDKEIIAIAAKESGFKAELFEQADERERKRLSGSILGIRFPLFGDGHAGSSGGLSNEMLFKLQSDVIRRLANKGSCIFIGRCADYILRDRNDVMSVFITASEDDRITRLRSYMNCTADRLRTLMDNADNRRSAYYNYYTGKIWGAAASYDLCLNSSTLGVDKVIEVIRKTV